MPALTTEPQQLARRTGHKWHDALNRALATTALILGCLLMLAALAGLALTFTTLARIGDRAATVTTPAEPIDPPPPVTISPGCSSGPDQCGG